MAVIDMRTSRVSYRPARSEAIARAGWAVPGARADGSGLGPPPRAPPPAAPPPPPPLPPQMARAAADCIGTMALSHVPPALPSEIQCTCKSDAVPSVDQIGQKAKQASHGCSSLISQHRTLRRRTADRRSRRARGRGGRTAGAEAGPTRRGLAMGTTRAMPLAAWLVRVGPMTEIDGNRLRELGISQTMAS